MNWLVWALIVLAGALGTGFGDWRRARYGRTCYAQALVNHGVAPDVAEAEAYWWYRPDLEDDDDEAILAADPAQVRALPAPAGRVVGDDGGGEGAPGVLAGDHRPAIGPVEPRPGQPGKNGGDRAGLAGRAPREQAGGVGPAELESPPSPGHRGYGPYLAAIGRDDPAGWYANLTAADRSPASGPAPEAAWLERQLYEGAVWSARLETWGSRFTDAFHADVAAWDRMAARWADEARWVLVGSRCWPPPELAGAA